MEQLILPSGDIIASGVQGEPAMVSVCWRQNRNDGTEISLGTVCCAELEIELFSLEKPDIPPETRLIYQEDGVTRGIFYCQDITRLSQNRWLLTALDGMHRFYKELNGFWETRTDDTALTLLQGLCDHCGVTTKLSHFPGCNTPLPKLAGYSGKQILRFIGQLAARYFYLDEDEALCAGWYEKGGTIENFHHLKMAEFDTAPIQRVLIRQTKTDAGIPYPEGENEANTLIIQGNPIFAVDSTNIRQFSTMSEISNGETFRQNSTMSEFSISTAAQRIFEQVRAFTHTPFTCRLLPGQEVSPGTLVEFTDPDGIKRTGAVMQWEKRNGVLTVRGTGSHSLQSVEAFTALDLEDLEGQVLSVSRTAQGLSVAHTDLLGDVGALQLSVAGISTQVTQGLSQQSTALSQTAQGLSFQVSQLESRLNEKTDREELTQVTEHFQFDADGLTIQNSATGMGIRVSQEQVAFLGGDTAIYPDAMQTTKLTVQNRLDIGDFSYLPRTNGNLSLRFTGQ